MRDSGKPRNLRCPGGAGAVPMTNAHCAEQEGGWRWRGRRLAHRCMHRIKDHAVRLRLAVLNRWLRL
jgi:hypothetical protein